MCWWQRKWCTVKWMASPNCASAEQFFHHRTSGCHTDESVRRNVLRYNIKLVGSSASTSSVGDDRGQLFSVAFVARPDLAFWMFPGDLLFIKVSWICVLLNSGLAVSCLSFFGALKSRDLTRRHQIKQHDWTTGIMTIYDCALTGALSCHTLARSVVRECFKGDEASQWKRPKFDPSPHQNSLTDLHKNWQAWLRPGRHPACKIL